MLDLLVDLWRFMRVRKKYWLSPIILVMVLLGGLLIFVQGSAIAPCIYTIFCSSRLAGPAQSGAHQGRPSCNPAVGGGASVLVRSKRGPRRVPLSVSQSGLGSDFPLSGFSRSTASSSRFWNRAAGPFCHSTYRRSISPMAGSRRHLRRHCTRCESRPGQSRRKQ